MTELHCPTPLPITVSAHLADFAKAWAACADRPRVDPQVRRKWAALLDDWIQDVELPLLIRRASAGRGCEIKHISGRTLVPTDNSPAHWSLSLALNGETPTVTMLKQLFEEDRIPIAMILNRTEAIRARYRCTRAAVSLNDLGWKVAHIQDVGLGRIRSFEGANLPALQAHCRRFLDPNNMFLVPLQWGGLAETREVIDQIRDHDTI